MAIGVVLLWTGIQNPNRFKLVRPKKDLGNPYTLYSGG